jgi:hypothetical protein
MLIAVQCVWVLEPLGALLAATEGYGCLVGDCDVEQQLICYQKNS